MATLTTAALIKLGGSIIEKYVGSRADQMEAKQDLQNRLFDIEERELQIKADQVAADQAGTRRQRNWRPNLMYVVMGLLLFYGLIAPIWNYVFVPIINMNFGEILENGTQVIVLRPIDVGKVWEGVPKELWTFLTFTVTGYSVGRSGEKILGKEKNTNHPNLERQVFEAVRSPVKTAKRVAGTMFDRARGKPPPENPYAAKDEMTITRVGPE